MSKTQQNHPQTKHNNDKLEIEHIIKQTIHNKHKQSERKQQYNNYITTQTTKQNSTFNSIRKTTTQQHPIQQQQQQIQAKSKAHINIKHNNKTQN